jgi:threonine dehydrogenase-like Zn-dependent dehydrogenase
VNLCDNRRVFGVSCSEYRQHGTFAEYAAVPQRILYRLPENLSFEQASLVEPLAIAVHAVHRVSPILNASAVVLGVGMIGLLVVQALQHEGCGLIVAVDVDPHHLELARKMGAHVVLEAHDQALVDRVRSSTQGRGVDAAFEAVGIASTVKTALEVLRKDGKLCLIGNLSPEVVIPLQSIVTREISLAGSCASNGEYPVCLDLMARGDIDVRPLISATAPLSEGPVWFRRLYDREGGLMKVVLIP